jgi:hypothetical protein
MSFRTLTFSTIRISQDPGEGGDGGSGEVGGGEGGEEAEYYAGDPWEGSSQLQDFHQFL